MCKLIVKEWSHVLHLLSEEYLSGHTPGIDKGIYSWILVHLLTKHFPKMSGIPLYQLDGQWDTVPGKVGKVFWTVVLDITAITFSTRAAVNKEMSADPLGEDGDGCYFT